eukprot:CAMPEP_0116871444 /NCGR_PEP_ID=MMETSP0463-20121206/1806_1 /TAXON_ID=181622 /ORGANISM="Strombidinopsis sp, Strain SopsisLIS2011" /LENGTH=233 /DNA_ID=CAMNT_0004509895 /DNA_START=81 /DNA_END=782 /DNA_ORIENTATION=+
MNQFTFAPQMMSMGLQRMQFSTDIARVNKGANLLRKAVEKEIKFENENYTQLEDIETFLNESGFTFNEEGNGIKMSLNKSVGDKQIEVHFEARQPLPDEEYPEEEQNEHEEDEERPSENFCDFTVFITESDGKRGLVVDATSMDTSIQYNSIACTEDIENHKTMHRYERAMKAYAGPEFTTLDERIQNAITQMLEGYGIDEHLAAFVECMSLDKDQRLYMQWLGDLKGFVDEE